jgi:hypothetical protein
MVFDIRHATLQGLLSRVQEFIQSPLPNKICYRTKANRGYRASQTLLSRV